MFKYDTRAAQCQELYEALISALRHVSYRHGYALTVHGSLRRDIDLVACPWRTTAVDARTLILAIAKAAEAIVGVAREREDCEQPEQKALGRLAWSFYLTDRDDGAYLDISVMPRGVA
jgi:hypothetical protein